MWRMLWMALGVLTVAVSACEQTAAWGNGDYEVVALIANN